VAHVLLVTASTTHAAATRTRDALVAQGHTVTLQAESALGSASLTGVTLVAVTRATRTTVANWLKARWAEGRPILVGGAENGATHMQATHVGEDLGLLATANSTDTSDTGSPTLRSVATHAITAGFTGDVTVLAGSNWAVREESATPYGTRIGDIAGARQGIYMTAFDSGAAINGSAAQAPGATAPARAVFCGWFYAGQNDYTADGKTLLGQMVAWLTATVAQTVSGESATVTVTAQEGTPFAPVRLDGEAAQVAAVAHDGAPVSGAMPLLVDGETAYVAVTAYDGTPVVVHAIDVGTQTRNLDTSTRRRTGEGFVDVTVPVAPEPPTIRAAPIRVVVDTLPAADVNAGTVQPMTPTVLRDTEWGRVRVVVSGEDVTYLRDKPTQVVDYQLLDPYGYGPATLRFPQVTFWELPDFGTGGLRWLTKNAQVRIQNVHAGQGRDLIWFGHIDAFDFDDDGALLCDCSGELIGRMDKTIRTQRLIRIVRDAGHMAHNALAIPSKAYRLKGSAEDWSRTGTPMENTGGGMGTNLAFLDYLLANMTDQDLQPWTILPTAADPRTFNLTERDQTTTHATVYLGARGVQARLRDDQLEQPTREFGEGVAPNGARWRNAVYPNLWDETPPEYPFTDGRTFGAGTSDADTDTGVGVFLLEDELWGSGLLDLEIRDGTWSPRTTEAVEEVQRQAGLPVTGRVDPATWRAVFGDADSQWRMTQAEIRPLAWRDETEQWLLSANGSKMGRNPTYDRSVPRIERLVSFGEGVRKRKARAWLRREMNRCATTNWRGTVTLASDVLAGEHTFGQPGTPLSRLDLKAGQNIRVKRFGSAQGFLMHIASVQVSGLDGDSPQVQLAVDTQFRDALTLAEMLERDKAARRDPARQWLNQHRRSTIASDSLIGWDREAGAGKVRPTRLTGGTWNVVPFVGGQAGEVQRVELHTNDNPAEFVCAVFAMRVSPGLLNQRIGDPFIGTEPGEVWRRTDVADWLAGLSNEDRERWRDAQRERENMKKDEDGKWQPPEYEAGNIVRNDRGEWESVLNPPSGQEVADLEADLANQREERLQTTFELFSDQRAGVYVAGTTEQPCGYWPKSKTNANGNPSGEPVTGDWRDDASFSYWTIGPGGPWLYLAVYPDRDCTIRGRLYDQLIEGA
jgi:peptidoglycan hydrolase-like protein with peptidoglycan-binding domain